MMRYKSLPGLFLIITLPLCVCLSASAVAAEIYAKNGCIDWHSGYIVAVGYGVGPQNANNAAHARVLARLAAKVDAQRNLLEIIKGLRLDADTTVLNLMANDVIRTSISGFIKGAEIVPGSERWNDGVYSLKLQIPISRFLQFVPANPESEPGEPAPRYTGLIIDARGLKYNPQVHVQLVDENGSLIYGIEKVNYEVAMRNGLSEYTASLEAAVRSQRIGTNPLIVKALRAQGKYNSILVLDEASAQLVRKELAGTDVLKDGRVVIVTN